MSVLVPVGIIRQIRQVSQIFLEDVGRILARCCRYFFVCEIGPQIIDQLLLVFVIARFLGSPAQLT